MPIEVQRKRTRGWRMPAGAISVTRPGKWGNPFRVGHYYLIGDKHSPWLWLESLEDNPSSRFTLIRDAEMAIEWFRKLIESKSKEKQEEYLSELRGKDLACWCKIGDPCHRTVLLELANK